MKKTSRFYARPRTMVALTVACLAITTLCGCTSRKQYAINESILIGERRQLEDEIYRVQFELRDALAENERLRAELEEKDPDYSTPKPKRAKRQTPNESVAPRQSAPQTDEDMFPGGDALRTSGNAASQYPDYPTLDMNEVAKLPDFAVVPRRLPNAQTSAPTRPAPLEVQAPQPQRRYGIAQATYRAPADDQNLDKRGVSQEYDEEAEEEIEEIPEDDEDECEEDEENVHEYLWESANDEDAQEYDEEYEEEPSDEDEVPWSPIPR